MIVYGTRSKVTLVGEEPVEVPCDACGQEALVPIVVQRYVHVFWIPFFPTGKRVHYQCQHCKRALEPKEGPAGLAACTQRAKAEAKTPVTHFAGIGLLALVLVMGAMSARRDQANTKAWAAAPMGGDLLVLRGERVTDEASGKYIVARVVRVQGDDAELRLGRYAYDLASGAERAAGRSSLDEFDDETVTVPRTQLVEWQRDGGLTKVLRR